MHTLMATENRHESTVHPEQHTHPVRRVGLLDRAALHLGVALIKWGRRPGHPAQERRVNRAELALLHRNRQHVLSDLTQHREAVEYGALVRAQ